MEAEHTPERDTTVPAVIGADTAIGQNQGQALVLCCTRTLVPRRSDNCTGSVAATGAGERLVGRRLVRF